MSCCSNSKNLIIFAIITFFLSCTQIEKKDLLIKTKQNQPAPIEMTFPTKRFKLFKSSNYELEEKFINIVEETFIKTYELYKINFNYKIIPEGTIYPYSEVSIKCITDSNTYLNPKFKDNCQHFFELIEKNISKIREAEK